MRRHFGYFILALGVGCSAAAGQSQQKPPAARPQRPLSALSRQQPPSPAPANDAIEGFVYWDANAISHKPSGTCAGLAITASVASSSGGGLEAYTPLATLSNNFKYVGQVKSFLYGGRVVVYDVCAYGYDHVPGGVDLHVQLSITQPAAFSPIVEPQVAILGPVKIINAKCNMLPRIMNPTASDLMAHWGTCQNRAYDVNFPLLPAAHVLSSGGNLSGGSGGLLSGSGSVPAEKNPGPQGTPLLKQPGPIGTPLLKAPGPQGIQPLKNPGPNGIAPEKDPGPPSIPQLKQPGPAGMGVFTNADVMKLVKGGIPDSIIISKIQAAQGRFDLSPAGCRTLAAAHVSRRVLAAMGDGSVQPCFTGGVHPGAGADDLNPQPLPPRGFASGKATKQSAKFKRVAVKIGPPKALRRISNPHLSQQDAGIIAVLQKQKQAAEQEWSAMKLGIRPQVASGALSQTTSPALAPRTAAPATLAISANRVGTVGAESTSDSSGNLNSKFARLPNINTLVLTCSHDTTPRILHVSGGQGPGVFTPEAKYNLYTIIGCGFGPSAAGNSVYLYGGNGFHQNLFVDFWSDNGITAHMDPALAGVLDQDNVTLVVAPSGQQPFQKSGFKFYAARGIPGPDGSPQEVQLVTMPQAGVGLFDASPLLPGYDQVPQNALSQFSAFNFSGTPVAGWVFRYGSGYSDQNGARSADCFVNQIGYNGNGCTPFWSIGEHDFMFTWPQKSDTWDFSKLVPGFWISSYQLFTDNLDPSTLCGAWDELPGSKSSELYGNWDYNLASQNSISVTWAVNLCTDHEMNPAGRNNKVVQSSYGLAVWVLGPRCVDPWTGQRQDQCVKQVQQSFGS